MRIAAVIPSYNAAHLVGTAIDSVLAQTRPLDEIIVVDDGSRDNTLEVLSAYGGKVRYVSQSNRGLAAARNAGLKLSSCEWVAFLDADDWWRAEKIERQERQLLACPDAVLCYSSILYVFSDGSQRVQTATDPARILTEIRFRNCVTGSGSAVCVRRDALLEIGAFRESLTAYEDWDAWCRLAFRHKFTAVAEPVTVIRVRPGSVSSDPERMLRNLELVVESTLLEGLKGWRRSICRRRVRSAELFRAAMMAREARAETELTYLLRSLREWPSPFFRFRRHKALALYFLRNRGGGCKSSP